MVLRRSEFATVIAPDSYSAKEALASAHHAKHVAERHLGVALRGMLIAPPEILANWTGAGCEIEFGWPFFAELSSRRLQKSVLQHEIGHEVFIKYLAPPSGEAEYGGRAADWLDEMAAIVFEDTEATDDRRLSAVLYGRRGKLISLQKIFTMSHPEWVDVGNATAPTLRGSSMPDSQSYYATIRVLLDYLLSRTGNERVIAHLASRTGGDDGLGREVLQHLHVGSLEELDKKLTSYVDEDALYKTARGHAARISN